MGGISLAPTLAPLVAGGLDVRSAVARLHREFAEVRGIQLDATLATIRPRELDQRARKDLLSLLRRHELTPTGIDFFIPSRDYLQKEKLDRAMSATRAAIELAADLGRLPVSLSLPVKEMDESLLGALVEAALSRDVTLAVYAEDQLEELLGWVNAVDLPTLGVGLDPAALLARGIDPVRTTHQWASRLRVARVSDAARTARCPLGQGDLSVLEYRVAVDLAAGLGAIPRVLDLRGLADPWTALRVGLSRWGPGPGAGF